VGPWLLVPLGLLGLAVPIWGRFQGETAEGAPRHAYWLWALVVPAYAVSVALFFVSSRYRLPLLVPLAIGTGLALVRLTEDLRQRDGWRLAAAAVVLVPLLGLASWPHGLDDGRGYARGDRIVWLIGAGRLSEAQALLERTEPTHPEAPVLLFRVGRALQAAGQTAQAIPVLERALARAPDQPEVRYTLGQCLLEEGRAGEAVPHLRAAFDAGVRRDLAGFDLARALVTMGRGPEAASAIEDLIPLPLDPESRGMVARLALQVGAPEVALRHLDAAVADAPEDPRVHELRGLVLARTGRTGEARRALEEAVRLDPRKASAHLNLAVLHAQEGRFGEARAAAQRALELRPGYPQARALLERLP
jgi:tetratricopeptide (TPR) repeat protein